METMTATEIHVGLGCSRACDEFTGPLYLQMASGKYDECAVLPLPTSLSDWRQAHRTARKRADRAYRRGYGNTVIQRHRRAAEIHAINISAAQRQGRPMSTSYNAWPSEEPLPTYPCGRHAVRTYGVEDHTGTLVAYAYIYRAGDLVLVSQILGHADHLENEIMYLLAENVLACEVAFGPGVVVYNRWDSGTDGLRFFKERLGFQPMQVEWLP